MSKPKFKVGDIVIDDVDRKSLVSFKIIGVDEETYQYISSGNPEQIEVLKHEYFEEYNTRIYSKLEKALK